MKTLDEIKKQLADHKAYLFANYPLKSIAIFGSYGRDEADENSDLDLLVEFNGNIGIEFIDLANDIEKLMNMKVDLVSKNGVKSRYLKAIEPDLTYV